MNNISALPMAARLLAAASALCLSLTASAVELVGKPVPVGKAVSVSSVAADSRLANSSASTPTAVVSSAPNEAGEQVPKELAKAAPPIAPVEPIAPIEPIPPVPEDIGHSGDSDEVFKRHSNWDSPDLLVPVIAMSLLFGGPVILVIVLAFFYYRAKARRQENLNANIDKLLAAGRDIPVELLLGEDAPVVRTNQPAYGGVDVGSEKMMHKGVRNIGLGVGALLFFTIMFGFKIGSFAFIFIGLGISQVVVWLLSGSRNTVKVEE